MNNMVDISQTSEIQGPCLSWCFNHNKAKFILIGIVIGLLMYHLYSDYTKKSKYHKK